MTDLTARGQSVLREAYATSHGGREPDGEDSALGPDGEVMTESAQT